MQFATFRYPIILIFLLAGSVVYGQDVTDTIAIKKEENEKQKMPFVTKTIIGAGYAGAVYMAYLYIDAPIQHETQEGKSRFSDALASIVSEAGEDKYHYMAAGSMAAVGFITRNPRLKKTVLIWSTTLLINDLLTNKIKNAVHRYRPSSGKSYDSFAGPEGNNMNRSFPSAHTSSAFATATVFATIYKEKGWVAPVAYGMATLVGVSRVYKNAHWTSDVLAGAAIGFLSAKTSYKLINLFQKKNIMIAPSYNPNHLSVSIIYKLK